MKITLTYSPAPRVAWSEVVDVAEGITLADLKYHPTLLEWASRCPQLQGWHTDPDSASTVVSIWTHKRPLNTFLKDGDRVEWSRPLTVDPKVARRERFQSQGARTAGLFSKRRQGAKAGY